MSLVSLPCIFLLLVFALEVLAHGHVTGIVADGKYYMGYTPNIQYMNPVPKLPAWSAGGYGQGGIMPDQYANVSLQFSFFHLTSLKPETDNSKAPHYLP